MNKRIEQNVNLDTPLYLPSQLESPKEKQDCFEVSILKRFNDILFLIIGYNKILQKSNISGTDSSRT